MKRSLVVEDSFHCPDNITSYISFPLFHFSFLSFLLLFFLSKFLWKYNVYRKVCCCLVVKSCSTLCNLPGSSVCGILQARILDWVAIPSPGDLPNPQIKPGSPALQADSLLSEPPGKLNKNSNQEIMKKTGSPIYCWWRENCTASLESDKEVA